MENKLINNMKKLIIILLLIPIFGLTQTRQDSLFVAADSTFQMIATEVETTLDPKFRMLEEQYIAKAIKDFKTMMAQETINSQQLNHDLSKTMLADLRLFIKNYRVKFLVAKERKYVVDTRVLHKDKESLNSEINRLKSAIVLGGDSTVIQPHINALTNKRNDVNKLIKSLKPISNVR